VQIAQTFQFLDLTLFWIVKHQGKYELPFGNLGTMANFECNNSCRRVNCHRHRYESKNARFRDDENDCPHHLHHLFIRLSGVGQSADDRGRRRKG
jgi:hypothetical protein